MKSIKQILLLLIASLMLTVTDSGKSFAASYSPAGHVQEREDNGIFKNKKKKKKDCDCPGNKKNRRKVARERRKNNTH
jgi:hypothetical protein